MPRSRLAISRRTVGIAAALGASLVLSGCGFDAQTLQPYTPAQGVNANVTDTLLVRNMLVMATDYGLGQVSASLMSNGEPDALIAISGAANKPDGTPGAALTVSSALLSATPAAAPSATPAATPSATPGGSGSAAFVPIELQGGRLVVLTGQSAKKIYVSSPDLKQGLTATFTLTFASGAVQTIVVPVVDASDPIYNHGAADLT